MDDSTQFSPPTKTSKSFSDLPMELQLQIIENVFIPNPPCLEHVFGQCCDQWGCESGCHPDSLADFPHYPDPSFSKLGPLFFEEGHKAFYRHNIFVFNRSPLLYRDTSSMLQELVQNVVGTRYHWRLARDPRALGFLNLVDETPSPPGISDGIYPPRVLQRFAEQIRHLVLCVDNNVWPFRETGWEWPLNVDWTTLPNLETLCLDLRSYSRSELSAVAESQETYDRKLAKGAERMEFLDLKRLVLVGLCSGLFYEDRSHRCRMKKLFEKSVARGVEIELWDSSKIELW